jgi:hypothetical protein
VLAGPVDWITETLVYARDHGYDTFEPTAAHQEQWMTMVETLAPRSIFSAEHSHYYGANVEGKVRKFLLNPGGRGKLHEILDEMSATENYGGAFSRGQAAGSGPGDGAYKYATIYEVEGSAEAARDTLFGAGLNVSDALNLRTMMMVPFTVEDEPAGS